MDIKSGDIVQSSRWAELVQVRVIEEMGDFIQQDAKEAKTEYFFLTGYQDKQNESFSCLSCKSCLK